VDLDLDPELEHLDPATLAVRDLIGASRELVGRMARRMGMNATDMSAIGALVQNGPMGATRLADHLSIRSASATLMIDRLERSGHVERRRDPDDRRRVVVAETPAARAASLQAWAPLVLAIDAHAASLPPSEREVVVEFLTRVVETVAEAEQQLPPAQPRYQSGASEESSQ
jgi:DNA-binding MarR family transcriptional regulator